MFEVLPISLSTGAQPSTPLVDCLIDGVLMQTRQCSNQSRIQISNVEHGSAVDTSVFVIN